MRKIISILFMISLFIGNRIPLQASSSTLYTISSVNDFLAINDPSGSYVLTQDLDFTGITNIPRFTSTRFQGSFDGQGHTLSNITLNIDTLGISDMGLFGYAQNASFENIRLVNLAYHFDGNPFHTDSVGLLVGNDIHSSFENIEVRNSSIETELDVPFNVGGIVGVSDRSTFSHIIMDLSVSGEGQYVGGLVGLFTTATQTIDFISAKLDFTGGQVEGGLFGAVYQASNNTLTLNTILIRGSIASPNYAAGLSGAAGVDAMVLSDITTALHFTAETGTSNSAFSGFISDDQVTNLTVNRFFSQNSFENPVSQALMGTPNPFVDVNAGTIQCNDCFYLSNQGLSDVNYTALSPSDALNQSNYTNYDFTNTWVTHPKLNSGYPMLRYDLGWIEFEEEGGTALENQPYFKYEVIPTPLPTSLSGSSFNAWMSDASKTQIFDFNSNTHSSNLTLHAKWNTPSPVQPNEPPQAELIPNTGIESSFDLILVALGYLLYKYSNKLA